jgi:hypothetical protein
MSAALQVDEETQTGTEGMLFETGLLLSRHFALEKSPFVTLWKKASNHQTFVFSELFVRNRTPFPPTSPAVKPLCFLSLFGRQHIIGLLFSASQIYIQLLVP